MTEKVTIERRDDMPMPLNLLAGPEDLAAWYREGLLESLEQGERALAIACFDTEGAFNLNLAAQAVLRTATDVLSDHPEAESLTIFCEGEKCWSTYRFWWNMLYAEHKPEH